MNLKHVEEMAKDKDIMYAYMVSCFMCYRADASSYEYKEDIPKCWCELTDEEKADLISMAEYIYFKDYSGASLGRICDLVMEYQYDIDGMSKNEILDILADYECGN